MVTNTINSTHNDTSHEDWVPFPVSQCIPWLFVLIAECLAIVILNIITIIVFVKQRQLQRRSTYLIIHLAIVDLLAGTISGPLNIDWFGSTCYLWDNNWPVIGWVLILQGVLWYTFPLVSIFNLAVISLERVHATFCPLKHRLIKKWVYGVIISGIWLVPTMVAVGRIIYFKNLFDFRFVALSYYFTLILVVCVCYISIYLKVRCSRHPQHHGAAGRRERKLTSTLFLVTLGSLLACLPIITWMSRMVFQSQLIFGLSDRSYFPLWMIASLLFFGNSLINPIIYAMRMPELRAAILQIIFRRAPLQNN